MKLVWDFKLHKFVAHSHDMSDMSDVTGFFPQTVVTSFTNSSLVSGVLVLNHVFGDTSMFGAIVDGNRTNISFDDHLIQYSNNQIRVDLSQYNVTGNWQATFVGIGGVAISSQFTNSDNVTISGNGTSGTPYGAIVSGISHEQLGDLYGGTVNDHQHLTTTQVGVVNSVSGKAPTDNPTFTGSITTPIIKPASDSTSAIKVTKADGITGVMTIDSTNTRVGIGTTAPQVAYEIAGGSSGANTVFMLLRSAGSADNTASSLRFGNTTATTDTMVGSAEITGLRTNTPTSGQSSLLFKTSNGVTLAEKWRISYTGSMSNTGSNGLAYLHLKAGTATAGTAPLKFTLTDAVVNGTPEAGVLEPDASGNLYFVDANAVRRTIKYVNEFNSTFTSSNSTGFAWTDNTLVITHNLGVKLVNVIISDGNDLKADYTVTFTSTSAVTVSFPIGTTPISGTWNVRIN